MTTDPRYEAYKEWLSLRTASMERRAREMGVPVYQLNDRYNQKNQEQARWHQTASFLGYREGEGPVEFLRRINKR